MARSWEQLRIVVCTHVWADGPAQALRRFLNEQAVGVQLFVGHPLLFDRRLTGSGYELYEQGRETRRRYARIRRLPGPLAYVKDVLLTVWFVLRTGGRFDAFVGFNNLNALAGLILRSLGKVDRVVYYVVDYTPRRFGVTWLNRLYHAIERYAAVHCDETWNLSDRMVEGRIRKHGLRRDQLGPQRILPMGFWLDEVRQFRRRDYDDRQLVYMGHLLEKNGVQSVLRAMPAILSRVPDFHFLVIGDGEYRAALEELVGELGIGERVRFAGYVPDLAEAGRMIAGSALAVALYERGDPETNWTYYADPGKLKDYLGMGVPVLLTDVPPNAAEIEAAGCGRIIAPDPDVIADAVVGLLGSPEVLRKAREAAESYAEAFDWRRMFGHRLEALFGAPEGEQPALDPHRP